MTLKLLFKTLTLIFFFAGCTEAAGPEPGVLPDHTFEVLKTLKVGQNPHGMQKQGKTLFLAAAGENRIEVIDLENMKVTGRWPAPDVPLDLTRVEGGWLVSAFRGDYLHLLDENGQTAGKTWAVGEGPSLFASGGDREFAYIVSEFADRFTVFDRRKKEITASYETGKRPYPAAVTHDGVLAFIPGREGGDVTVLDLLNGEEVKKVKVCEEPLGGALTRDEVSYMVTCGGEDKVKFINTASFEIVAEISEGLGGRPFSVATSPDEKYAFVNNSRDKTISVINLEKMRVVQRLEVGEIPIVMRVFEHALYVASEGANTLSVIPMPPNIRVMGGPPNEVVVMGMIHGGHESSDDYSLKVVKQAIRAIDPDIVIAEIPPNRLEAALSDFQEDGVVEEPRVRVFPEYVSALFPLTREMDFEIRGGAAWNVFMNKYRNRALEEIRNNPGRAGEWQENRAAKAAMSEAIGSRWDDPLFIHSDQYDALQKQGWAPYAEHFQDDLGPGSWENINAGHYRLIEKGLDEEMFKGKRILITFGSSHKYWFLEKLRQRDDITLLDAGDFFKKLK